MFNLLKCNSFKFILPKFTYFASILLIAFADVFFQIFAGRIDASLADITLLPLLRYTRINFQPPPVS